MNTIFKKIKDIFGVGEKKPDQKPTSATKTRSIPSPSPRVDVYSPFNGTVVLQKDIPDEGFSEPHIGIGLGVDPSDGNVKVYMDGELTSVSEKKHAYFIKDKKTDVTVMLHTGIDTVEIPVDKKPFVTTRKAGEEVKVGESLCTANLQVIREAGKSTISALLFMKDDSKQQKWETVYYKKSGDAVRAGELLMSVVSQKNN